MAIGLSAPWLALAAVWIAALPGGCVRRAGSRYPLAPCAVAAAWQGVLVWGWALPLVFALARPAAALAWNALGLLALAAGVAFEADADWQLARHRADPARRGTVLQSGLWALSRHPNYFGEALVWWGFFLFALSHPWGWIGIASPLYVTWFMTQGSATRMTDAYLHKHRPDYAAYAARVPAFWPRLWR